MFVLVLCVIVMRGDSVATVVAWECRMSAAVNLFVSVGGSFFITFERGNRDVGCSKKTGVVSKPPIETSDN